MPHWDARTHFCARAQLPTGGRPQTLCLLRAAARTLVAHVWRKLRRAGPPTVKLLYTAALLHRIAFYCPSGLENSAHAQHFRSIKTDAGVFLQQKNPKNIPLQALPLFKDPKNNPVGLLFSKSRASRACC